VLEPHDRLADSYETIAEVLSENGYYCIAFLSGPFLRAPYNMNQGFSQYDDGPSAVSTGNAHGDVTNPAMEEKITAFLRSSPPRPFFLFAYFWDVHYDFIPPAPYDTLFVEPGMEPFDIRGFDQNAAIAPGMSPHRLSYVVSQYDGEIRSTDEMFGRIFRVLRDEGLWENTAILLTADHGEEFFEHGEKGHKNNLHRESVHVPLLLKRPGGEGGGGADTRLVTLLDVFPTIAEIGGAGASGSGEGRSLLGAPGGERDVFLELRITHYGPSPADGSLRTWTADMFAASDGDKKYIRLPRDRGERLYDLAVDPKEARDLSDSLSAELPVWREKVDNWHERMIRLSSEHGAGGEAPLSADERERLEALGYIRIAPRTAP
jgi:arylsulfatase A-like enzyme